MSAMQRRKGRAFEQLVARDLRHVFEGERIARGWQAREGDDAPDIICPLLSPECKHQATPNIPKALEQAEKNRRQGTWPVAVTRRTGGEIIASMYWEDFLELLKEHWELRNK